MKRVRFSISLAMIVLSAIALTVAATDKPGSSVTVGTLARDLSAAARTAGATEVSRQLMKADLGKSANAPLTEAGAVALLKSAGFAAITSNPDRFLTREQADVLVRQFRSSLVTTAPQSGVAVRKGGLPGTVDTCYQEKNHGLCVKCCKALGGGASLCANKCMVINKPSGSEPLP